MSPIASAVSVLRGRGACRGWSLFRPSALMLAARYGSCAMRVVPWLVLVLGLVAGCDTPALRIRRIAEQGTISGALRAYREHVRERGSPNPDALAEIASVVLRNAAASSELRERSAGFSALRSLGMRARDFYLVLRQKPGVVGDRAAAALYDLEGREGPPPDRLLEAARSIDPERRVAGLAALEGRRDLLGLVAALDAVAAEVRRAAAQRLARFRGESGAFDPLVRHALHDPDPMVRAACVTALAEHGERALPTLQRALEDTEAWVRTAALSAVVRAHPVRGEALLASRLGDVPTPESLEAARILASRGHQRASEHILAALQDERPSIRAQAAVAAAALGSSYQFRLSAHIEDADAEVRLRIAAMLVREEAYRARAIRALQPLARQPDPHVAIRALTVLAEAEDGSAAEPLRGALRAPEAVIRRQAVIAWSHLVGTSGDADPLAPLLEDPDLSVRLTAATEIVRITAR